MNDDEYLTGFMEEELVKEMIDNDISQAKQDLLFLNKGFKINSPKENPPSHGGCNH